MRVAEARRFLQRLKDVALRSRVTGGVKQTRQAKMGVGRIGRIEQQHGLIGLDGGLTLAQGFAGSSHLLVRFG